MPRKEWCTRQARKMTFGAGNAAARPQLSRHPAPASHRFAPPHDSSGGSGSGMNAPRPPASQLRTDRVVPSIHPATSKGDTIQRGREGRVCRNNVRGDRLRSPSSLTSRPNLFAEEDDDTGITAAVRSEGVEVSSSLLSTDDTTRAGAAAARRTGGGRNKRKGRAPPSATVAPPSATIPEFPGFTGSGTSSSSQRRAKRYRQALDDDEVIVLEPDVGEAGSREKSAMKAGARVAIKPAYKVLGRASTSCRDCAGWIVQTARDAFLQKRLLASPSR